MHLKFFVAGYPAPKGSKKGYVRGGRAILVESSKHAAPWAQAVHWDVRQTLALWGTQGCPVAATPMQVRLHFEMPRVGRIEKRIGVVHDRMPDLDKLVRCVLDALTGLLWKDDGQVWKIEASKAYVDPSYPPGVHIEVEW